MLMERRQRSILIVGIISATVCQNLISALLLVSLGLVIYIDQPIGTGFSYGTDTVNSTTAAAPFLWKAIQILFDSPEFCRFKSRE
jgi:hypothetical protein